MAQARSLSRSEIKRALSTCLLMSNPLQKQAILSLSFSGLRVTELSLLLIEDVLTKQGKIKTEIYLRSAITKGCKARSAWLSEKMIDILSNYFEYRISQHLGTSSSPKRYRGLNPKSKVILSSRGASYSLKAKTKTMYDGTPKTYYSNDTLEALIRSIYSRCGLHGASSHSGRRSLATSLNKQGVELDVIAKILGHSERNPNVTLSYIDISDKQISKVFEVAF
ncbi:site-specific integrase [Photobacterium japonica]|uniref:tyrosine-type recombinase/integrase n=1 Tax=Photobacterium japonica TaxID=2910235 RepID=UPI003D0DDA2C